MGCEARNYNGNDLFKEFKKNSKNPYLVLARP